MGEPLLQLDQVSAGYGAAQVLFGMSLHVDAGEVVTLIGRNGMGKTTTIRTVFGLLKATSGRVCINGTDMTGAAPYGIARAGLGYVPEGRQIFPRLSVEENIIATASPRRLRPGNNQPANWDLKRVYGLFPRLAERRSNLGTQLSGGEQQMLAIGRALMTNPTLLVLDEATEGLAPVIRGEIWSALTTLRGDGLAVLVVDKNLDALLRIADRHVVVEKGQVTWSGTTAALKADMTLATRHLEL